MHNIVMDNKNYNSLAQKLIQNGLLNDINSENFFEKSVNTISYKETEQKSSNRINEYDCDLIKNRPARDGIKKTINFGTIASLKLFRQNSKTANLFFKFFPKLRRAKDTQDAIEKLSKLNIDTKKMLEKTIPYGESETRYNNLVEYLNYINEIQSKLKK